MHDAMLAVKTIQTYTLVAAVANGVAFLIGTVTVIAAGISTFGCGCILIVLPMVNLAAAVIDLIAYSRLNSPPTNQVYSFVRLSAVVDLLACFALVPLIMGILKIQLLASPDVHDYFEHSGDDGSGRPNEHPPM